ncbi:Putative peptide-N4-(N-acetyl-beta-glucosaminyl)asparagine amidase A [Septoria linicola]|uniref:Peptide-N4-(N-acetyl-beta-glucosaminyl)asparagine amidase A n=1 Tax=Septoria linicola TaxID=215465 RepID=A0A9Q9B7M8_9PEZI|nr:Putative peptide-N4-(N-acetyl-beta-glucosaminyl)asparagine amidase A [Septoria linicola]
MAGWRIETNHNDGKKAVPSLATATPLVCGDQVDSLHATLGANRRRPFKIMSAALAVAVSLVLWSNASPASEIWPVTSIATKDRVLRDAPFKLSEVFQVYPPVLTTFPDGSLDLADGSSDTAVTPSSRSTCQSLLVEHSFASSYGQPYVGTYTPPQCNFNRVAFNLTVKAAGRQFDRLGSISFGDIELFRTSTAEPSKSGISWVYIKDMSNFLPLFMTHQTLIFDLGNIVNDVYTAPFNVTLTAAFFTAESTVAPADLIIPVSKRQGAVGQPSFFQYPRESALNEITIPQNVKRAVFTVAATGQADEEFWWGNVPQSRVDSFSDVGALLGFSPFREVQLYIDNLLAGVVWPFPVIFTGGVVPGLWRPVVGIDAFDLKEDEIDITPWLGHLCDGNSHTFAIRVSGLNDSSIGSAYPSNTTGDNWWLTGKIFLWLDTPGHVTTSSRVQSFLPAPKYEIVSRVLTGSNGSNQSLTYDVVAHRRLQISSQVNLANGTSAVSWSQHLSYTNLGNYTTEGDQTNKIQTSGQDISSSGYQRSFEYPLYSYSTQSMSTGNLTLTANVSRGKSLQVLGPAVFPTGLESFISIRNESPGGGEHLGALLHTSQNGTAYYTANQTAHTSYSYGTTEQEMSFSGIRSSAPREASDTPKITQIKELFHRYVKAVNDSVIQDEESLLDTSIGHRHSEPTDDGRGMALSGSPGRGAWARGWR